MRAEANAPLAEARGKELGAVRIGLLGGFSVTVEERKVAERAWRLRKAASLIKLLALAPSHRMHRERAMDLLWPDLGLRVASNNLRQTLHVARKTLHSDPQIASGYLSVSGEQLLMCPQGQLWVDVDAFEEAANIARRSKDPAAYRAAIELYSGELLFVMASLKLDADAHVQDPNRLARRVTFGRLISARLLQRDSSTILSASLTTL